MEKLQPVEATYDSEPQIISSETQTLTARDVEQLYRDRYSALETMKQWVGLKFYYRAAEKIKREQDSLRQLLRVEDTKKDILAEYSFVLDTAYFEQRFLPRL